MNDIGPTLDKPVWLFGYGSLIWRVDFPFLEVQRASIEGWARRFWQGSTPSTHRTLGDDNGGF